MVRRPVPAPRDLLGRAGLPRPHRAIAGEAKDEGEGRERHQGGQTRPV